MDYTFALGSPHPDLSGAVSSSRMHLKRHKLARSDVSDDVI